MSKGFLAMSRELETKNDEQGGEFGKFERLSGSIQRESGEFSCKFADFTSLFSKQSQKFSESGRML